MFRIKAITESVYDYAAQRGVMISMVSSFKKKIIGIDDEKYERIILNFISNAIKFTPQGKSITVILRSIKGKIRVEVEYSGIGIISDKLVIFFDKLVRLIAYYRDKPKGQELAYS